MADFLRRRSLAMTVVLLTSGFARARASDGPLPAAHLHWSDAASIESPDGLWSVRVEPSPDDATEDNGATVTLVHRATGATHVMFHLERDAWLYWSPDRMGLLVEDHRSAENGRVLLFELGHEDQSKTAARIDSLIRHEVTRGLGPREEVLFYFPHVVSWTGTRLIISGAMTAGVVGKPPARARCVGVELATRPERIVRTLSELELRRRYGDVCRFYG